MTDLIFVLNVKIVTVLRLNIGKESTENKTFESTNCINLIWLHKLSGPITSKNQIRLFSMEYLLLVRSLIISVEWFCYSIFHLHEYHKRQK